MFHNTSFFFASPEISIRQGRIKCWYRGMASKVYSIKNGDPITSVLPMEITSHALRYNTDLQRKPVIQFTGAFKSFAAKYSDSQILQNIRAQGQLLHAATG